MSVKKSDGSLSTPPPHRFRLARLPRRFGGMAVATAALLLTAAALLLPAGGPVAAQGGAPGTEPTNVQVVPGDGILTVSWTLTPREGVADEDIRHALRWSQEAGVWDNPAGATTHQNDGVAVGPGVTSYTIRGLQNGLATGVFVRSYAGRSGSERSGSERSPFSSKWVRVKGEQTTPQGAEPTPTPPPQESANCPEPAGGDYDSDDDRLIEVSSLAQLNAIRWDLNGDGSASDSGYATAYPNPASGMGCPASGCVGYELTTDLDFDTNGNGQADSGDTYWSGGAGWTPIGFGAGIRRAVPVPAFTAVFDGNGHTISNMRIKLHTVISTESISHGYIGLFSYAGSDAVIRNVGLESVDVSPTGLGQVGVGGLAGINEGTISNSYVAGVVSAYTNNVGGMAGYNTGKIIGSYATASVTDGGAHTGGLVGWNYGGIYASYATGNVSGAGMVGGLVGNQMSGGATLLYSGGTTGEIVASYATGNVLGYNHVGGLAGNAAGTISASYSLGTVTLREPWDDPKIGGLVGNCVYSCPSSDDDSYWDTQTSGQASSPHGVGKTTAELQSPTSYAGIYANWNVDVDGDDSADDPWDFGASCQYPVLKYGGLSPDDQRAPCTPPQANRAPTVASALADRTIVNNRSTSDVSLSGVFSDADSDALTITAVSDDEAVATVSVATDYSTLTVTAKARGTATITVTADDGNGGTVSDTFTITVKAAPVVASALADVSGLEAGDTRDVSLSGAFTDADGDSLTITAASSDGRIATVTVASDQSQLTVAGEAEGRATITVTAQDTDGNTVSDTFDVLVVAETAPAEEPAPPTPGQLEPFNVRVTPGDGALTVTWTAAPREGFEDDAIRHALRWSQVSGVWGNPPGPSGAPENGIVVEGGVASYTITGLENGVAAGVFVRSFTGSSYSERSEHSSQWVRTKGAHTTPKAAE